MAGPAEIRPSGHRVGETDISAAINFRGNAIRFQSPCDPLLV